MARFRRGATPRPTKARNSRLRTRDDIPVHALKPNAVGTVRNTPNSYVTRPKNAAGESRGSAHGTVKWIARARPKVTAAVVYAHPVRSPSNFKVVCDPPTVEVHRIPGRNFKG